KALHDAGKSLQSLERLERIRTRVFATGYGPLLVSWTMSSAGAQKSGDPKGAATKYEEAFFLAETHRLDGPKARAEIALGNGQGNWLGRRDEGHRWMRQATATIARMGGDAKLEVERDLREGWIYNQENRHEQSAQLFRRALERARDVHLDDPFLA